MGRPCMHTIELVTCRSAYSRLHHLCVYQLSAISTSACRVKCDSQRQLLRLPYHSDITM